MGERRREGECRCSDKTTGSAVASISAVERKWSDGTRPHAHRSERSEQGTRAAANQSAGWRFCFCCILAARNTLQRTRRAPVAEPEPSEAPQERPRWTLHAARPQSAWDCVTAPACCPRTNTWLRPGSPRACGHCCAARGDASRAGYRNTGRLNVHCACCSRSNHWPGRAPVSLKPTHAATQGCMSKAPSLSNLLMAPASKHPASCTPAEPFDQASKHPGTSLATRWPPSVRAGCYL